MFPTASLFPYPIPGSHIDPCEIEHCVRSQGQLRKLYLRVHPDLFSSYPKAKQANEKSFQHLTEFLSTIKQGSMHTVHTSTEAFPLNFYMRPTADQSTIHSEDDLERVNLTLRAGGSNVDRQKQLKILFKACGLSADFLVDAESAGYGRNSLEGFLYDVGAEAVQRKMQRGRELRDVVVRQHMLHLHHNIRVTFTEGQASKEQCDALDKMLDSGILEQISKMGKPGALYA